MHCMAPLIFVHMNTLCVWSKCVSFMCFWNPIVRQWNSAIEINLELILLNDVVCRAAVEGLFVFIWDGCLCFSPPVREYRCIVLRQLRSSIMCMVGFLLCIVITLPSGREALYKQWAHIYFWALTNSSFVWRAVRIIQGPSIGAFQLALKWKLAMFINNPSANWWSAKMINRLGIDCLLHKTISLALLSTGFSPEQTLNIYQHGTAGAQPE